MSTSVIQAPTHYTFIRALEDSRARAIPWHIWISVAASTLITLGLYWDISWHMTIGRDTFWTPAHLLIQLGAVLAACASAYSIFRITFSRDSTRKNASVRVLGFRGSLGAFICAWGGAVMLVSAPFDNWWHNAYGLDVKIVSPPHTLLAIGFDAIVIGSAILILREMNQAEGGRKKLLGFLLLIVGGAFMALTMMGRQQYTNRTMMHSAVFYLAVSMGPPLWMEAMASASEMRWARTLLTSFYTSAFLLALWVFPLFPGKPRIGPVYQHVTHMVSLGLPVMILAPAVVLDWLAPRMNPWSKWRQACLAGSIFIAALLAVHWPLGDFLMSPASHNRIFGTDQIAYLVPPTDNLARNVFETETTRLQFWLRLGWAVVSAILCSHIGITFGNWMRRVRR